MMYDYIIAGGGAAGLSLAYHLAQSNDPRLSLLIVDRDAKDRNDRTWCFWTQQPTIFEHLVYHSWDELEVVSEDFYRRYDLAPYRYQMIRGIDFYQGIRRSLSSDTRIEFIQGRVNEIQDARDQATAVVTIDQRPYEGRYVFDSLFQPSDYYQGPPGYHYLKQHFKGWEIETDGDTFTPGVATLFDFRTPQKDCLCFFYLLPFSSRRALVEYTLFSANILKQHEYDRAIHEYLETVRHISNYRILSVENGVIPMTDRPFKRLLGHRRIAIGTKAGRVKPSTGYAFKRIVDDAAAIQQSIRITGGPGNFLRTPWRYQFYDHLMLQVMHRQGNSMKSIFVRMFEENSIQSIFQFLDEEAPLHENIRFMLTLPKQPFLKALFRTKILRRV